MINIDAVLSEADWLREDDDDLRDLGGPGSGNFGHSGRPGSVGGSGSDGGFSTEMPEERGSGIGSSGMSPGPEFEARKKELGVPPGWTDVRINKNPKADLLAVGKDSKGRTQYLYSAEHDEKSAAEKFARLKEFNKELPKIRERIQSDLKNPDLPPADREAAAVLTLIDKTGFRVGSDDETGADVKAYGASTLLARQVKIKGDRVEFTFIGKKGVPIAKIVKDKELAEILAPRVAAGGRLFDTSDDKVRDYLHSRDGAFKVKDFRTWNGTSKALETIKGMPVPKTQKEFDASRRAVGDKVALHLGNTRTVALASYIDPAVWSKWKSQLI